MNEREYHNTQEDAATGEMIAENLKAILGDYGRENVQQLGRALYKYTDAGVSLSVRLHDGTWRWCGNLAGIDNGNVRSLGVSSIVEGSDAEVPLEEFDLLREEEPEVVLAAFRNLVQDVNNTACDLWHEANCEGDCECFEDEEQ